MRFLLAGICAKGWVYEPSIPRNGDELKARITEAVSTIDRAMLGRFWQEFGYRIVVWRVANGSHIERLWAVKLVSSNSLN